jgi:negative regulator of flagellin synthesis FlgM
MKIPSSLNVPAAGAGPVSDRPGAPKAAAEGSPAVVGASVRLSPLSSQLTAPTQGVDFDHAKVESIKQAIADGKLTVHADAVADRLIANALALSNSSNK